MNFDKLRHWYRSLLVQMATLTVIFLLLGLVYVSVVPYLQYKDRVGVLERTENAVHSEIFMALNGREGRSLDLLNQSKVLAGVAEVNKKFRYYIDQGDRVLQYGAPPKWQNAIDFPQPQLGQLSAAVDSGDCGTRTYWSAKLDDEGVAAYVFYRECNGNKDYVEYAGIEVPTAEASSVFNADSLGFFWRSSRELLVATLGFMLIAGFVLLQAARSLRRVADLVESFEARRISHQRLPEEGIPSEVLPLIRAINELVQRAHESQEQQHFFLATAAHEMRTPMAIVRSRLEELPDSSTKEELRSDVRRLASLVEQLLRLISIHTRDELPDDIDLVSIARAVVADRAPLAIAKQVELGFESDVEKFKTKGDQALLKVALANLVDNAISFSNAGDVVLVGVERNGAIAVRDHGPGLDPQQIERIFEPFAKIPPNRKGHGLGLAIVKAIMKLHGGKVVAANAVGSGACFTLRL